MNFREFNKNITKLVQNNKIFFFYGENNYVMLETVEKVKDILKLGKETLFCWEVELEEVVKKLSTLDLFSPKNMVVLRHFELAKKSFKKSLIDFLKNYNGINLLIILYEEKILKKIQPDEIILWMLDNYLSVEFDNLTTQEIVNEFITKKTKIKFTEEALKTLLEQTNNDLYLLSNELEKLSYFVGDKRLVTEEDVLNCVAQYETTEIKELIDSIVNNNFQKCLSVINLLLNVKKTAEVAILSALSKFFRKSLLYKNLPQQKVCKILQELQNTDLKLKTRQFKEYALEGCVLRLMKIYHQ